MSLNSRNLVNIEAGYFALRNSPIDINDLTTTKYRCSLSMICVELTTTGFNSEGNMILILLLLSVFVSAINSDRTPGKISEEKCAEYSKHTSPELNTSDSIVFPRSSAQTGGLDYPHMALIAYDEKGKTHWQCGATLISEQYILTAGHCIGYINKNENQRNYYVKLGVKSLNTLDENTQKFNISKSIIHPHYIWPARYNDIGLIKLDRAAKINSYVKPACLYLKPEIKEKRATLIGYGVSEFAGDINENLRQIILDPSVSEEDCKNHYRENKIAFESMFCAAPIRNEGPDRNACQGDSGSPLQTFDEGRKVFEIIGVTTFGKGCDNIPGIYERVSYHIKWIEDTVWP